MSETTDVGKVRETLRAIETLYAELLEQAMFGGNNGRLIASAPIPGGDATNALGPWSYGHNSGAFDAPNEAVATLRLKEHYGDTLPNFHPLLTLETWAAVWREWFGQETALRATVGRASAYLRLHLADMQGLTERTHPDGSQEWPPDYDEMARDLRNCRATLENIVYDGIRDERSQVPCLDCPDVRLVKVWASIETLDWWKCPRCRRRYTDGEYLLAKRQHLGSEGAERFVPLCDAVEAVRAPRLVVKGWLRRGDVLWCLSRSRVPYVMWSQVRELDRDWMLRHARPRQRRGA